MPRSFFSVPLLLISIFVFYQPSSPAWILLHPLFSADHPIKTIFSLSSCGFVSCEGRQRLHIPSIRRLFQIAAYSPSRYRLWLISSSSPPPAPPARASIRYPRPSLDSTYQQPCSYLAKPTDPFLSNACEQTGGPFSQDATARISGVSYIPSSSTQSPLPRSA